MSRNFELLQQAGWGQQFFESREPRLKSVSKTIKEGTSERPSERPAERGSVEINVEERSKEKKNDAGAEAAAAATWSTSSHDELTNLVHRVFLASPSRSPRVVMFSGLRQGSGSAWLCAKATKILAQHTSESVCAVDTNFQQPSLHRHFREQNVAGLGDTLHPGGLAKTFARQVSGNNLWLLTAGNGPADGFRLVANPAVITRLTELHSEFGYVLIDAPPVDGSGGTAVFGRVVEGVILILDANGTPRETALRAKRIVESTNAPVVGVVLNQRRDSLLDFLSRIIK